MRKGKIVLTVTNDLNYDQRMQRICSSLATAGYDVTLVGRRLKTSFPLQPQGYQQKRLPVPFSTGPMFYISYNLLLFFYLLFTRADAICAVDLDTILPCYFASLTTGKKRIYDAHELFTEQKEIVTRPLIHKAWLNIERFAVPKFLMGYTVNEFIVKELNKRYAVQYGLVRNLPKLTSSTPIESAEQFIIYQGAVNEGRSFETLIPAMKQVNAKLIICGEGNFFSKAKELILLHGLEKKIELKGYVLPAELKLLTPQASAAVTIFESTGLNQYYSLSNRFFDYIMAGVPQLCVNYPEYKAINDVYQVAYMIDDTKEQTIADALNELLTNQQLHLSLAQHCLEARQELCWEKEEQNLLAYWKNIMV